ncbi:aspartate aminotransferase family protein, partial [Patescibacteria group bacterium]
RDFYNLWAYIKAISRVDQKKHSTQNAQKPFENKRLLCYTVRRNQRSLKLGKENIMKEIQKATDWEKDVLYTTTVEDYPVISYGHDVCLWDTGGKVLVDATAQVGIAGVGQCDSEIKNAVKQQMGKSSSLLSADFCFRNTINFRGKEIEISRVALAKKLIDMTEPIMPGRKRKVMTEVTGALAVNAALKLAKITHLKERGATTEEFRKYHNQNIFLPGWTRGLFSSNFLAFKGAFHGRHGDAALLSGSKFIHRWGLSSSCGVGRLTVPYKGWEERSIRSEIDSRLDILEKYSGKVLAFVFEPILGEGGIIVPETKGMKFLIKYLREEKGIWIIADEIQTGLGRTGKMFGCEHYDIEPDVVCLSKALASGMPLSAVVADSDIFPDLEKGMHSGSFHWTPVSVASAIVTLNIIEERLPHWEETSDYFIDCVKEICGKHKDIVTEVRGKGFMVGVEFKTAELRDKFIWKAKTENAGAGLLLHSCGDKALRFYPRVNADYEELNTCIRLFRKTFVFM